MSANGLSLPLSRVDLESEYFASHLEPFLNTRTAHFMHELVSFAKSPYDVIAYDGKVRYSWPDGRVPPSLAVGGASAGQGSSSGDTIAGKWVASDVQYTHTICKRL